MPYSNAEEFAVWCKTLQLNLIDCKSASALACARMTGRVRADVSAVDELRPGDHIAFNNGAFYYYQHAIVSHVEGMTLTSWLNQSINQEIFNPLTPTVAI